MTIQLVAVFLLALVQAGDKAAAPPTPAAEKASPAAVEAAPAKPGDPAAAPKADAAKAGETPAAEKPAEEEAAPKAWYESGALGYMIEGGFFMWPILVLGVLAAGVIIERYRSLKMLGTDTSALRHNVLEMLQSNRVEEAYKLCDSQQGPVPAILATGLRKLLVLRRLKYDPGRIEEQVVKAMDDYGVHIGAALERHLPILATVSSVAPMLGFLGTVQGMVISFADIVATMGQKNIVEAAAGGIMVSLLTTVFGLVVGIPAFTAFNYYTSVINRFVLDVEESATELIEAVTLQMSIDQQSGESNS